MIYISSPKSLSLSLYCFTIPSETATIISSHLASLRPPPPLPPSNTAGMGSRGDEMLRCRALVQAAMDGDLDVVTRMAAELERGTGTGAAAGVRSPCGHSALHFAAAKGRTPVCRYLVQNLSFPVDARSSSGETPLVLAARSGHSGTAAYLLDRGADPRAPDSHGETPLHWAARNGDLELARLLLDRGADACASNHRGTPLHAAASLAHPEVVALLLHHGADPNKVANHIFTPLFSSLLGDSLECMRLLIQSGAKVNTGGFSGTTPLFLACQRCGTVQFVKCLLEAGANPNVTDEIGRLPIEVAVVHADINVVELLFSVTQCPPTMLDWSVAGLVAHVNSDPYKERVREASFNKKIEMKRQGNSAFERTDYDEAILFYNMAMKFDCDDNDATLYSNRSICWLRQGVGGEALSDAEACIRIQPDWAKGYYRKGMALSLLEDHAGASAALLKAKELDPESSEIKEALGQSNVRAALQTVFGGEASCPAVG